VHISKGALGSPIKLVLGAGVEDFSGMQEYAARFFPRIELLLGTPKRIRSGILLLHLHGIMFLKRAVRRAVQAARRAYKSIYELFRRSSRLFSTGSTRDVET